MAGIAAELAIASPISTATGSATFYGATAAAILPCGLMRGATVISQLDGGRHRQLQRGWTMVASTGSVGNIPTAWPVVGTGTSMVTRFRDTIGNTGMGVHKRRAFEGRELMGARPSFVWFKPPNSAKPSSRASTKRFTA
jgi:hypothetical protein